MKRLGILPAALVMGLGLPALAQAPQFHVALSAQFGDYTGPSEQLALRAYNFSGPNTYNGEPVTYGMDSKVPLQLDMGIRKGDDDYVLSYWAGKASGSGSFVADSSNRYFSPYADFLDDLGASNGHSEVKAHTLDLSWNRTFVKNDLGSLAFSVGVREFKIERHMVLDQFDTSATPIHMGVDTIDASTKGFGLTLGFAGSYTLTPRLTLNANTKVALINGKTDFEYQQSFDPAFDNSNAVPYYVAGLHGQKETSLQVDSELRLNLAFAAGFDGFIGYRMKSFQNVLGNDSGTVYGYENIPTFGPSTVGFNGFLAGVAYRF